MLEISERAKNYCILCLDPDREWLNLLGREFRTFGFREVLTANDPKKALTYLQHCDVDLVITYHNLKFVKFLRESTASPDKEVAVIMLTNKVGAEDIFAIRDAGVNEIAVKPCSITQIMQRIEAVASNPRRFVWAPGFTGPDRRRKELNFAGPERRDEDESEPV